MRAEAPRCARWSRRCRRSRARPRQRTARRRPELVPVEAGRRARRGRMRVTSLRGATVRPPEAPPFLGGRQHVPRAADLPDAKPELGQRAPSPAAAVSGSPVFTVLTVGTSTSSQIVPSSTTVTPIDGLAQGGRPEHPERALERERRGGHRLRAVSRSRRDGLARRRPPARGRAAHARGAAPEAHPSRCRRLLELEPPAKVHAEVAQRRGRCVVDVVVRTLHRQPVVRTPPRCSIAAPGPPTDRPRRSRADVAGQALADGQLRLDAAGRSGVCAAPKRKSSGSADRACLRARSAPLAAPR